MQVGLIQRRLDARTRTGGDRPGAGAHRPDRIRECVSEATVGRHAPARRLRAGARRAARSAVHGRAVQRTRRPDGGEPAHAGGRPVARLGTRGPQEHLPGDAQHRRGGVHRHAHRHHLVASRAVFAMSSSIRCPTRATSTRDSSRRWSTRCTPRSRHWFYPTSPRNRSRRARRAPESSRHGGGGRAGGSDFGARRARRNDSECAGGNDRRSARNSGGQPGDDQCVRSERPDRQGIRRDDRDRQGGGDAGSGRYAQGRRRHDPGRLVFPRSAGCRAQDAVPASDPASCGCSRC